MLCSGTIKDTLTVNIVNYDVQEETGLFPEAGRD